MATDGPGALDAGRTDPPPTDTDAPHPAFEGYARESVEQAAVGAPGKDGRLELSFAAGERGTTLVRDFATAPFHVSGTLGTDPHPAGTTVMVQSPTGSVAQGDRRAVTVEVGPDAIAHVTTGASSKVHSMTHNYAAAETRLAVAAGGHLDHVPEPLILHADARLHRSLDLTVEPGGSAVVGEVVVPGRLARDERFAFERYRSRLRATDSERLLFEDTTHLAPGDQPPDTPGVLGEFAVHGTLVVVAPGPRGPDGLDDILHAAVAGDDADGDDTTRAGATALPNGAGVLVRALGDRADPVLDTLYDAWDLARRELVGAPAPPRGAR
jgi:urease accessory protein